MLLSSIIYSLITATLVAAHPSIPPQTPILSPKPSDHDSSTNNISLALFAELEELSRIVDISYCVGTTGIFKPFVCASRCAEFPAFELVDTFNTGPLMSDSCGYIVLDHGSGWVGNGRVLVVFRGTYSIANTIVDLSTVPQEYVPFPGSPDSSSEPAVGRERHHRSWRDWIPWHRKDGGERKEEVSEMEEEESKCLNCTVHTGFWTSWQNARRLVLPHIAALHLQYPDYRLDLVGHSLGGAVAGLAALEFDALGLQPVVTTFGEPRIGNSGLRNYIDKKFDLPSEHGINGSKEVSSGRYRRITHIDDPVPLLPLQEWGYRSHAGEHFISKASLQPTLSDIRLCYGDEDTNCIASSEAGESWFDYEVATDAAKTYNELEGDADFEQNDRTSAEGLGKRWGIPIPARYKMWQLFFAHRDYFWRLGLCVPGGDPLDWGRDKYRFGDEGGGDGEQQEAMEEL
ncbi:uncharacterized protein L3040_008903 [Drepanopeziza brunnea f. sp. 'multigermtubi']|uniref:Extracellular lipase n=1 Tax=Marssonina brunnea f. sp. multigermtubi (strain MB_m1) TaxID=1072389 RepID=K1X951_MARBU|nr:extracellular lipase [Drepanopeziza brunnea f. sp. 'multigermtubi' MB_m1]EKD17258.1 extracellular lipase [Drepanopeziza brunnea f. sp. 'multigermtubi' MB_m1]KAJ5032296.1 hypothetical protein L3040_008903 [Drepanopeziza brunnea f. sp. 'multigermtubi']